MILILQTKNNNSLLSLQQSQYQFLSQSQFLNCKYNHILHSNFFLLKQQLSLWWIVLEPDFILKIYQIDNFLHRITVQFQITYCSSFPSERNFIYLIDDTLLNSYSKNSHNFVRHKNCHSYDIQQYNGNVIEKTMNQQQYIVDFINTLLLFITANLIVQNVQVKILVYMWNNIKQTKKIYLRMNVKMNNTMRKFNLNLQIVLLKLNFQLQIRLFSDQTRIQM
ncbi:unnamed protein product [Paramecium pentaurelia]|uniref:Uncharacterized protein n=1 Tax=Paramecium pentaurelia TaxID=43138 RepID=A0A8S1SZV5_9CILI|nr:unnamed protein product [Paramecium pentaurelia]